MTKFTASLIAGGRSRRMGRDKRLLTLPAISPEMPLWQVQLDKLRTLRPVQLLFSGEPVVGLPSDVTVVPDLYADAGPLSGIQASLQQAETDLLLVLAVDLPWMTASYLAGLLSNTTGDAGCIPVINGQFQALSAVYPRSARLLARELLEAQSLRLQDFAARLEKEGRLNPIPVPTPDFLLFKNLNTPADLDNLSNATSAASE